MELKIREKCRYALACPTSMGVRITPDDRMAVHNSNRFYMQATSAETNVLNVASSLGRPCLALRKRRHGASRDGEGAALRERFYPFSPSASLRNCSA